MRYLLEQDGAATREQLLERFGGKTTTWRDFKRQTLADLLGARRSYEGQPLQVGPPVIALDDSGVHLVENWRGALEEHRIIGQEPEAADEQKRRDLAQSRAFREFLKGTNPPDEAPTDEDLAEGREERQRRRRAEARVAEGMAPRVAAREVLGADGFVGDLRPEEEDDPPGPPGADDSDDHPLDCECLGCSVMPPRYATPAGFNPGRNASDRGGGKVHR